MIGRATKMTYKHRYFDGGFMFEYDTAEQLAELMFNNLNKIVNPYDPHCTDYDDFNEKLCELKTNVTHLD